MARPTLEDLAKAAGVGVSTVDRLLNGRGAVRRQTARRVQEAAERIGFYAAGLLRDRLRSEAPEQTLGFLLQRRSQAFYRHLGDALTAATLAAPGLRATPLVEFMDNLTPDAVAERLVRMGQKATSIALVAADHPAVTGAIDRLHGDGVSVVALISDLSAERRRGYAGLDNRKLGRTVAWFVANLAGPPGTVAVSVGSHRYQCQEANEIGLRSYLRENAPGFTLLEPMVTLQSDEYAYEAAMNLLRRNRDLRALFVAGGGIDGTMRALADCGMAGKVTVISSELTAPTRAGLLNGTLKLVLSHPVEALAARTIAMMTSNGPPSGIPEQAILPFEVHTPESL